MPETSSVARRGSPQPEPALDFDAVYRDYAAFVWRCLRRLGVRPADVADTCQEVFMIVHRRLQTYDGTSSVRTWLFGIAMRKAADHRRLARVRHEHVVESPPEVVTSAHQSEDLERARARALLEQALDELDDEKRAVLVLFELEQMPMQEVAAAVGCPLQTAYARLYAARRGIEASVRRRLLTGRAR